MDIEQKQSLNSCMSSGGASGYKYNLYVPPVSSSSSTLLLLVLHSLLPPSHPFLPLHPICVKEYQILGVKFILILGNWILMYLYFYKPNPEWVRVFWIIKLLNIFGSAENCKNVISLWWKRKKRERKLKSIYS